MVEETLHRVRVGAVTSVGWLGVAAVSLLMSLGQGVALLARVERILEVAVFDWAQLESEDW